jgi:hypothetical protein
MRACLGMAWARSSSLGQAGGVLRFGPVSFKLRHGVPFKPIQTAGHYGPSETLARSCRVSHAVHQRLRYPRKNSIEAGSRIIVISAPLIAPQRWAS